MNKAEARDALFQGLKVAPLGRGILDWSWLKFDFENLFIIDESNNLINWTRFDDDITFEIYKEPKKKVMHYRRKWVKYGEAGLICTSPHWLPTREAFDERYEDSETSPDWEEECFEIE